MNDDSWDLNAVVKSCSRATTAPFSHVTAKDPLSTSPSLPLQRETHTEDLIITHHAFNELEEICRPFFSPPLHHLNARHSSLLARLQNPKQRHPLHSVPRSKRRKNQVKKVVCQVPADGVCSDVWAWRKYGQKPIKGSPFPRGYYKCSSLKGCPARKLVERCRNDPNSFIVTYTAEHNHAAPAHRNCLAGSTRNKLADPVQMSKEKKDSPLSSSASDAIATEGLSPTTPLVAGMAELDVDVFLGLREELEDGVMDFSCYGCD